MNAIKLNVLSYFVGGKNHLQTKRDMFGEFGIHKCFERMNKVMKPGWYKTHANSEEEIEQCILELCKAETNLGRSVLRISAG